LRQLLIGTEKIGRNEKSFDGTFVVDDEINLGDIGQYATKVDLPTLLKGIITLKDVEDAIPDPGITPQQIEAILGTLTEAQNEAFDNCLIRGYGPLVQVWSDRLEEFGLGWNPFKKVVARLSSAASKLKANVKIAASVVKSSVKATIEEVEGVVKAVGNTLKEIADEGLFDTIKKRVFDPLKDAFDPANWPWTDVYEATHARREAKPFLIEAWAGALNVLELLKRVNELLSSIQMDHKSKFLVGPPQPTEVKASTQMVQMTESPEIAGLGSVQAVKFVIDLGTNLLKARDFKNAQKIINRLDNAGLEKAIIDVATEFAQAGGLIPLPDEKPDKGYIDKFQSKVQAEFKGIKVEGEPAETWQFYYLHGLRNEMQKLIEPMKQARVALAMANDAYKKTTMGLTVKAIGNVVKGLIEKGVLKPEEAEVAIAAFHKMSRGYILTEEEKRIVNIVVPHLKKGSPLLAVAASVWPFFLIVL